MRKENIKNISNDIINYYISLCDECGLVSDNAIYTQTFMFEDNYKLTSDGNKVVEFMEETLNKLNDNDIDKFYNDITIGSFNYTLPKTVALMAIDKKERYELNSFFSEHENIGLDILCQIGSAYFGNKNFKQQFVIEKSKLTNESELQK